MNRKKFTFSWGRKIFFGFSFPLSLLIGLIYVRSFILPASVIDWIYFFFSYIGQFGLLNIIFYYLLFCPLILLLPTYYVSRLWAVFLILILNLSLLLDALTFSSFHYHLYDFLSPEIWEVGFNFLRNSNVAMTILGVAFVVILVSFWIRGEIIWRYMQGRFSNPVKNWYLILIVLSFIFSKAIYHYWPVHPVLANVFPLHFDFSQNERRSNDNRKFFYPLKEVSCKGKTNPNIIMIVIEDWSSEQLSPELMPKIFHLRSHAVNYTSHMNVSEGRESGVFSFFYSLPDSYRGIEEKHPSVMFSELQRRQYEMMVLKRKGDSFAEVNQWLENRSGEEAHPFFLSLTLSQSPLVLDSEIDSLILKLEEAGILSNTEIILTGAYSSSSTIPLMWFRPGRKSSDVSHVTTPYDVIPTLMTDLWNCKNVFSYASTGTSLHKPEREWVLGSVNGGFRIFDFKNDNVLTFRNGWISSSGDTPRYELLFPAMKLRTKFHHP